jgi:hypothetical protein
VEQVLDLKQGITAQQARLLQLKCAPAWAEVGHQSAPPTVSPPTATLVLATALFPGTHPSAYAPLSPLLRVVRPPSASRLRPLRRVGRAAGARVPPRRSCACSPKRTPSSFLGPAASRMRRASRRGAPGAASSMATTGDTPRFAQQQQEQLCRSRAAETPQHERQQSGLATVVPQRWCSGATAMPRRARTAQNLARCTRRR